ncbi:myotubularin-related protein 10-B-like isoform X2 [Physella acuta]|uniref:myotubularin-related protein 10-B-like isoform X2 n=1 Tax=Physella acuta TaxID=109671 RepID=UPI0027DB54CC|nr:myotubularin-related protein 10-B-like isoform X2 [Physella acuta]
MSRRFKSYLNNFEMKEKGKAEEVEKVASAFFDNLHEPKKLQGERVIAGADSVLMFAPFSNRKQGISGHLFVTNFKISFVTADKSSYPDGDNNRTPQRNKLLENTDIPLTCVDNIYQVSSGARRKKLIPGTSVTTPTKYLEIHCKDFQIHVFGFKFTPKDQNKQVTDAVVHFSHPCKDDLLFAFEFGHSSRFEEHQSPQFMDKEDWDREIERLQCQTMWRVCDANYGYQISNVLPEYFVTPINLLNADIIKASAQFVEKRVPTWSYTYVNGASLIRMAHILPESDFKILEEKILCAIKESSGNEKDLTIVDLGRMCPSLPDIRASLEKLKSIIMTDSAKDFYSTDSRWLTNLESSQWLQHVSACLNVSNHVVNQIIRDSETVVLKEETGSDLTCVVSCLVQLQLDPEYRTINGFQSLVQKEWVVMGHPFQKRLHLVWSPEPAAELEQSPLFLLFLDCVWQLLQQFPSSFAFTETYLTTLWDTVNIGLFETFLFNSCWHRKKFLKEGRKMTIISLPSAWDWKFQLGDEQLLLFNNPLYLLRTSYNLDHVVDSAKTALRLSGEKLRENCYALLLGNPPPTADVFALQETILKPEVTPSLIKLWSQCFLRWIVPAQIVGGGNPSQYMQQCILAEEVVCLKHKLQSLTQQLHELSPHQQSQNGNLMQPQSRLKNPRPHSGLLFGSSGYQSNQKQLSSVYITSSFPFSSGVSQHTQHSLICGPLSRYLKDTEIDHDYAKDDED